MKFFITGGTGSLGQALLKRLTPHEVVVYSRDEGKQAALRERFDVRCIIGDVRDGSHLDTMVGLHSPDYIIHAAALKRVDDIELFPSEAVKTNILGTENVAKAAVHNGVRKCILISTDKACSPVNVYGCTKFTAERIMTNYDYNSKTTLFSSVRYGNVIASRGSFIPLWKKLLSTNQMITITDNECTRFLFTLSDAVDAVLGALNNTEGGEVFIPLMNGFKITDVARAIANIVGRDGFHTKIGGLRAGEKLHEDMISEPEQTRAYLSGDLICIKPELKYREYTTNVKYSGPRLNSHKVLLEGKNTNYLEDLIERGLLEAS